MARLFGSAAARYARARWGRRQPSITAVLILPGRPIHRLSGYDLRKLSNYRDIAIYLRAIVSSPCPIDLIMLLNAL